MLLGGGRAAARFTTAIPPHCPRVGAEVFGGRAVVSCSTVVIVVVVVAVVDEGVVDLGGVVWSLLVASAVGSFDARGRVAGLGRGVDVEIHERREGTVQT